MILMVLYRIRILQVLTRTPKTLNHHPRATVHRDAAIFELVRASDHIDLI